MNKRRQDIKLAFDGLKEEGGGFAFEQIARKLLMAHYPNLNPLPHKKDGGQDAVAIRLTPVRHDDTNYSFAVSLTPERHKLIADCERCKELGHDIDVFVFTAWGQISNLKRKKWAAHVKRQYGWDLIIHDANYLLDHAERPENEDLVADELHVSRQWVYLVQAGPGSNVASQLTTLSPSCGIRIESSEVVDGLVQDRIQLGIEQRNAWKLRVAVKTFRRVLKDCARSLSSSDQARVHANLAATYGDLGYLKAAEKEVQVAIDLHPGGIRNHVNLIICKLRLRAYNAAEQMIGATLETFGPNAEVLNLYACLLHETDRESEAAEKLDEAIELDTSMVEARVNRGLSLRRCGKLREALAEFGEACKVDRHNAFAHAFRLETLAHIAARGEEDIDIEPLLDEVTAFLGGLDRGPLTPPKPLHPALCVLHTARGILHLHKRNANGAQADFKAALGYEDHPAGHANLGMAYTLANDSDSALAQFRSAVAGGYREPEVLYNVATADILRFIRTRCDDLKLLSEASELYAEVRELEPDNLEVDLLEGLLICARCEWERSDTMLHRAKAIFRRIGEDKTCPKQLAIVAMENLDAAQKLDDAIQETKRRRRLRSYARKGRV